MLIACNLEQYADALDDAGFDDLPHLMMLARGDVLELRAALTTPPCSMTLPCMDCILMLRSRSGASRQGTPRTARARCGWHVCQDCMNASSV